MAPKATTLPSGAEALFKYERLKKIVAYLLKYQEEIGGSDKIQVTFDCAGKNVKAWKKDGENL